MLKPKPDPLKDLLAIQEQINKLFQERLERSAELSFSDAGAVSAAGGGAWTPPVDAWETEAVFVVRIELPGLSPEDVAVSLDGGTLTIRGERKKAAPSGVRSFHRMEREYGAFVRAFTLPKGVATLDVETNWTDGVLDVTVAKSRPKGASKKKK